MKRLSLISRLRYRKLLGRTVLILFSLTLATLALSYLFVRSQIVARYQQQSCESALAMLEQTNRTLDSTLRGLELQIQSMWRDENLSSLMVAPEKPDFSRASGAAARLRQFQQDNALVQHCYLYLTQSDQLLSDSQQLLDRGQFPPALDLDGLTAVAGAHAPLLHCRDGQLFLLSGFPTPRRLGLMVVQLDARAWFEQLQSGAAGSGPIYLYGRDRQPAFPNRLSYPTREELTVLDPVSPGVYPLAAHPDTLLCVAQAGESGWYSLSYLSSTEWLPSPKEIFAAFLPAAALLCLLVLVLSVAVLNTIYRPIQKIVQSMVTGQESDSKNEADLISAALIQGQAQNQRLTALLSDVLPALTDRFFQALLSGDQTGPDELAAMLDVLKIPFPLEGTYLVLVGEALSEHAATAVESEIYHVNLMRFTSQYWAQRALVQVQRTTGGLMAVVLCLPASSRSSPELMLEDYRQALSRSAGEYPFQAVVGCSLPVDGLSRLSQAYQQARQDLSYQKYTRSAPGHTVPAGRDATAALCTGQAASMVQLALSGQLDGAREQLDSLRAAVGEDPALLSLVRSSLLSEALRLHQDLGEQYASSSPAGSPTFWADGDRLLVQLSQWGQNSQRVYLERAKDYISAHFSDSSLSLNEVSEHVGLSVSYLSTLFSKYQPPGFSHYLRQYRVEKALLLLRSTDASVADIGYRTGFSSSNSFIRTFKSLVGGTPGKYRDAPPTGKS